MKLHHMKNYQPLLCDVYDYKRFAGNYVITKVLAKTDRFNRNYRLITVSRSALRARSLSDLMIIGPRCP